MTTAKFSDFFADVIYGGPLSRFNHLMTYVRDEEPGVERSLDAERLEKADGEAVGVAEAPRRSPSATAAAGRGAHHSHAHSASGPDGWIRGT